MRVLARLAAGTHRMSAEMGQAKVVGDEPEWVEGDVLRAVRVDVGNPHVVLHWGGAELPTRDELVAIGARIDGATPGGANVEVLMPSATTGALDMVVYERGVGPTLACGTGACASVAAAGGVGALRPHRHGQHAGRSRRGHPRRSGAAHRRHHLGRDPRHPMAVTNPVAPCR